MLDFKEAVKARRSVYTLKGESALSDAQIKELLEFTLLNVPSAFNSQSTRLVLLLGENHKKLWSSIVLNTLRPLTPAEHFPTTEQKIAAFAAAYGTVLFFEDGDAVKALQDKFPAYAENFAVWSEHTNAMHQFTVWTLLAEDGMGASLQHYNPIIDDEVKQTWGLPQQWKLRAQMPFGLKAAEAGPKEFGPLEPRLKVFK